MSEDKQPEGLYGPRPGEGLERHIAVLSRPPEVVLSAEEKTAVINFENHLMDGKFAGNDGTQITAESNDQPLSKVYDGNKYTNNRWEITLDYFLTDEGQAELKALGLEFSEPVDIEAVAADIRKNALDLPKGTLKQLYKSSESYMIEQVAQAIASGNAIQAPTRIVVFDDATRLMGRASGLFGYRKFLSEVMLYMREAQSRGADSQTLQAQNTIAKRYKKKVNNGVAGIEPDLMHFWQQVQGMEQPRKVMLEETLSLTWPLVKRLKLSKDSDTILRFAVRLDRLRNGAALKDGKFSAISESLDKLFEAETLINETHHEVPIFSTEQVEKLGNIVFDAESMQQFLKEFIDQIGMLSGSSESEYEPDRPQWADDEKWQVPIRDDIDALGFNGSEGALVVPASFERSLTTVNPPIGVISGAAHEVTHGFQETNMRRSLSQLRFGKELKGNGAVILREAGAIASERAVQSRLFGQARTDNPHYARALKAIEGGGDEIQAIKAFYESYIQDNPSENPKKAAKTAFTRVKRLMRRSGGFNSQPLEYAETALLSVALDGLDQSSRARILSEGALGIEDMAELHRFGLLDSNPTPFPLDEFIDYSKAKLQELLTDKA